MVGGRRHRATHQFLAGMTFILCCSFAALESLLNLSRVIYNCVNEWDPSCWSTPWGRRGGIAPETRYELEGLRRKGQLLS